MMLVRTQFEIPEGNFENFTPAMPGTPPKEVDRMKVHKVQKARAIPLGEINGHWALKGALTNWMGRNYPAW